MSKKQKDKELKVDEIIENTFNSIRDIIDSNTVIGKPITVGSTYIFPISKVSVGIITGGGNIKKKDISAGSGSGFNIVPIGFVTLQDGSVNYLPVNNDVGVNKVVDGLFKVYDAIINKQSGDTDSNEED